MAGFGWTLLAQAAAAAPADSPHMTLGTKCAIAAAVAICSLLLGHVIARGIKLPDFGGRIGMVLCTLLLGIAVCWLDWPPKKGIDLSGGVVLVYEIDRDQIRREGLAQAVAAVEQQLAKLSDVSAPARVNKEGQIEIDVPKNDERAASEQIKELDRGPFSLAPAGTRSEGDKVTLVYDFHHQQRNFKMDELTTAITNRVNPNGLLELTVRSFGADQIEIIIPEVDRRAVDDIKRMISTSGRMEFRILADPRQPADRRLIELAHRTTGRDVFDRGKLQGRWVKLGEGVGVYPGQDVLRDSANRGREILIKVDRYNVTGRDLSSANSDVGTKGLEVSFSLNSKGAARFGELTGKNSPATPADIRRRLGIVLDDELLSAPNIESRISDRGQITGNFSEKDVTFLVNLLNRGSLPAALRSEPVSDERISAQLGEETIAKGSYAMLVSTICVLLFMLVYYRFAGIVADLAVVMNMILTVALMLMVNAAFTLPGLAGLVLTVGMAVDANVLIYERMREESLKGASFRMTIRNGWSRAMSTIIDSNLTTVISGVVLYLVGTDQIKGFAVTLILGLIVSLYTAIYVARLLFDIVERKRWVTKLHMMQFIGETHIDFVKWRTPAILASLVVIGIGMVAVVLRGNGLFDIDFSGGSSVQMLFNDKQDIAHIRESLSDLPDLAVSSVGIENRAFKVDTSEPEIALVEKTVSKAFGKELARYGMEYGQIEPWRPAKANEAPRDKKAAEKPPAIPSSPKPDEQSSGGVKAPVDEKTPATQSGGETSPAPPAKETPATPAPAGPAPVPATPPPAAPAPTTPAPTTPAPTTPAPKGAARAPAAGPFSTRLVGATIGTSLFAMLQPPAGETPPAGPTLPAATDSSPAAPGTTTPPATTPGTTAPAATAAKTPPAAAASAGEQSAPNPAGESKPAANADSDRKIPAAPEAPARPTEGTTAKLRFAQPISYLALRPRFEEWLKKHDLENVRFDLLNPKHTPGSSLAFSDWTLQIMLPESQTQELLKDVHARLTESPVFPSSNQIGGKVAGATKVRALLALVAAMLMIVLYVWVRFQNLMFGLAAVLALVHDVLVTIGFLALSHYLAPMFGFLLVDDFKISLAVVAALLTIIGYSINDTIVIFDRIREIRGKSHDLNERMINLSVNQTLGRTVLTSGTVLIGTIILYFMGGEGIHPFAYAMLVGLISGTYSTVYIASPVLLWLRRADDRSGVAPTPAAQRKAAG